MLKANGKYVLASRVNQDCLENLFSRIRGIGGFHSHPLPSDVHHRLRLLLLSSNNADIPLSLHTSVKEAIIEPEEPANAYENEDFLKFVTGELLIKITDTSQLTPQTQLNSVEQSLLEYTEDTMMLEDPENLPCNDNVLLDCPQQS